MIIAKHQVIRMDIQSWMGMVKGASHYYVSLINTETGNQIDDFNSWSDYDSAFRSGVELYLKNFNRQEHVLIVCSKATFLTL